MDPGPTRPEFGSTTRAVEPGVVLVELSGDLDRETVGQATAALVRATADRPAHLVLDLSGVVFMGSDGISLLIAAHQQKNGISGELHVVGVADNRQVLRPLQLMNLTGMLAVEDDLQTVLDGIERARAAPGG